jgi:parallel beta-helix repeat protein
MFWRASVVAWVALTAIIADAGTYYVATDGKPENDGVKLNGDHNVVRNCWVHNNKSMGIAMHNKRGGTIENNLIEFNGDHIQFEHGVYADGDGLTVRGNVVRHNASYGLHLYPSIKNSRVENNLVYGQVRRRGIIVSCPEGGGKNVVVNNTVVENQPLTVWNGDGEVVTNNILVAEGPDVVAVNEDTQNVVADYNLCVPKSKHQGPHGLTADPRFVDATKGVFRLRQDSPAIGKGSPQYAAARDFWGRERPKDRSPDLGAFAFEPLLTGNRARGGWDGGWAYHRHGNKAGLPDPWTLPRSKPAKALP